jgi:NADPH-dependent 2,4-dienoyl-CoA reductase/sulfur reductase-like enzyme
MAQNFHVTPVTSNKPRESSSPSTILQLANGLIKAIAVPGVVPEKKLEGGRNPKVVVGPDNTATTWQVDGASADVQGSPNATPTKHKVIVVGAGISGLRAASVLRSHNVEVVVLEGRPDRIGGRIYTSRKPGSAPRDIGTYCLGNTNNDRRRRLCCSR